VGELLSAPGSSDVVALGNEELGYRDSPEHLAGACGRRHGAGMLIGCDHAPIAAGNIDHGCSGCSAIGLGQS
jgi:hypothetical protein